MARRGGVQAENYVLHVENVEDKRERTYCGRDVSRVNISIDPASDFAVTEDGLCKSCMKNMPERLRSRIEQRGT